MSGQGLERDTMGRIIKFRDTKIPYEERDGLYYPLITTEEKQMDVGKYGYLWMEFMKVAHPDRYKSLKRFCRLREKASELNEEAYAMLEAIEAKYLKSHKPSNSSSTMEMWQIREQARQIAEEEILTEIVNRFH